MMEIQKNVFLKKYTTLNLGGEVRYFAICKNKSDIIKISDFASENNIPVFPLGGGSNLIVSENLPNMVCVKMENKGIKILEEKEDFVRIQASAGENWDGFVEYCVDSGFSGLEALSSIPGTVGATPVQNVGAYGSEVSQTIESVSGYDLVDKKFIEISNKDCKFGYRDSIFKNDLKNKFIIESVVFVLKKGEINIPKYPNVASVLENVKNTFPEKSFLWHIRKTIQEIRASKLPDPKVIPNVGSFFKNVITNKENFEKLFKLYPDMPYFLVGVDYKIPSGWLIEKAGYKGVEKNGVGTYEKNALVVVNKSSKNTADVLSFAKEIQDEVKAKFFVDLEIEPEILML